MAAAYTGSWLSAGFDGISGPLVTHYCVTPSNQQPCYVCVGIFTKWREVNGLNNRGVTRMDYILARRSSEEPNVPGPKPAASCYYYKVPPLHKSLLTRPGPGRAVCSRDKYSGEGEGSDLSVMYEVDGHHGLWGVGDWGVPSWGEGRLWAADSDLATWISTNQSDGSRHLKVTRPYGHFRKFDMMTWAHRDTIGGQNVWLQMTQISLELNIW